MLLFHELVITMGRNERIKRVYRTLLLGALFFFPGSSQRHTIDPDTLQSNKPDLEHRLNEDFPEEEDALKPIIRDKESYTPTPQQGRIIGTLPWIQTELSPTTPFQQVFEAEQSAYGLFNQVYNPTTNCVDHAYIPFIRTELSRINFMYGTEQAKKVYFVFHDIIQGLHDDYFYNNGRDGCITDLPEEGFYDKIIQGFDIKTRLELLLSDIRADRGGTFPEHTYGSPATHGELLNLLEELTPQERIEAIMEMCEENVSVHSELSYSLGGFPGNDNDYLCQAIFANYPNELKRAYEQLGIEMPRLLRIAFEYNQFEYERNELIAEVGYNSKEVQAFEASFLTYLAHVICSESQENPSAKEIALQNIEIATLFPKNLLSVHYYSLDSIQCSDHGVVTSDQGFR